MTAASAGIECSLRSHRFGHHGCLTTRESASSRARKNIRERFKLVSEAGTGCRYGSLIDLAGRDREAAGSISVVWSLWKSGPIQCLAAGSSGDVAARRSDRRRLRSGPASARPSLPRSSGRRRFRRRSRATWRHRLRAHIVIRTRSELGYQTSRPSLDSTQFSWEILQLVICSRASRAIRASCQDGLRRNLTQERPSDGWFASRALWPSRALSPSPALSPSRRSSPSRWRNAGSSTGSDASRSRFDRASRRTH